MEGLNINNILDAEDIDTLFSNIENPEEENSPLEEKEKEEKETTEVINEETLFDEPESVGSEDDDKGKEGADSNEENASSPNKNFYSSIANALKVDGIFPDLDDSELSKITTPEDFAEAIEKQINAKFDERQKRIDDALNFGVEISVVKQYENTLNYLDSIKEDNINSEEEQGENLRKQLIYQDFINRGYSKERAEKAVKRSFDSGNDIEDAKEALDSNKEFFKEQYNKIIKDAQEEDKKEKEERKKQAEKLKKSILEDKEVFGEIELDKATRQKVFDSISKPIYKDPETGEVYTAIQKYELENRTDFLKNLGLLFTLTDGFKNIDKLVSGRVKKEVRKGIKELERTISNTSRNQDGSLNFASGVNSESSFKGWNLDI